MKIGDLVGQGGDAHHGNPVELYFKVGDHEYGDYVVAKPLNLYGVPNALSVSWSVYHDAVIIIERPDK